MNKSIKNYIIKNKLYNGINYTFRFHFINDNLGYYVEYFNRIKNRGKFGFYITEDQLCTEIIKFNRLKKLNKIYENLL